MNSAYYLISCENFLSLYHFNLISIKDFEILLAYGENGTTPFCLSPFISYQTYKSNYSNNSKSIYLIFLQNKTVSFLSDD